MTNYTSTISDNGICRRVPAEWEPYEAVMIAWPHAETDWAPMLQEVEQCYLNIAKAVTDSRLRLLVVSPYPEKIKHKLASLPQDQLIFFACKTNDTWTRDYGPITLQDRSGQVEIVDFRFDGWGLKFAANFDNMVNSQMLVAGLFNKNYKSILGYTFEGGSMEVDGRGFMLSTAQCLLSVNRNGVKTKEQLQAFFKQTLGIERLCLLEHGHLEGDDTDSHIDTLARLAPNNTILYVKAYDITDPHYTDLSMMEKELMALRTDKGLPYNLIGLPLPAPIYDEEGNRLPATYANFLITPSTILLPVYGQEKNDTMAKMMIGVAFPERTVIEIDCRALIKQHGSLHCSTMQLPHGVLTI